jgi:hypothetical protein
MLIFAEEEKPENPEKTPRSKGENASHKINYMQLLNTFFFGFTDIMRALYDTTNPKMEYLNRLIIIIKYAIANIYYIGSLAVPKLKYIWSPFWRESRVFSSCA